MPKLEPLDVYLVIEEYHESLSIEYVGLSWAALTTFVSSREWATAPRVEIWRAGNTKPERTIYATATTTYRFPETAPEGDYA